MEENFHLSILLIDILLQDLIIDPLWFEIRPGGNETVLLFDNGAGGRETEVEGRRIVAFGSKVHLNLLLRSLDWMGDGTFDVSPYIGKEKFYQLVRITFCVGLIYYCETDAEKKCK